MTTDGHSEEESRTTPEPVASALCPHCRSALNREALYCSACGRRASQYQFCESCGEPFAAAASVCPNCRTAVVDPKMEAAKNLDLEVRASNLGAFFTGSVTGLFLPPIIRVKNGRITVRKWSLLGLRSHDQEIQLTRVASVRYTKGIIWGGLLVETFGGASEDLTENGLPQDDALAMANRLKECLKD